MKNSLFAQERREKILEILDTEKRVDVPELVKRFQVTGATIRTDLKELEAAGLLTRTHGGAIKLEYERSIEDKPREREMTSAKMKIAKEAVKLIQDNEVIGIDTGTSCLAFAEELIKSDKQNLSILTYDLKIALLISENTSYRVQILGGLIRNNYPYVSSGSIQGEIGKYSLDKAFVATNAFDIGFGFSTPNYETAEIKKSLIQISMQNIFLCDTPKLNKRCFCSFAGLKDCDCLVLDSDIGEQDVVNLKKANVSFRVAE